MVEIVIIGTAVALFGVRQAKVRSEFLEENREKIEQENEHIAQVWRACNPRERKLIIDRKFKPPVFLAPTIRIKQKFKRDLSPWYERWFW